MEGKLQLLVEERGEVHTSAVNAFGRIECPIADPEDAVELINRYLARLKFEHMRQDEYSVYVIGTKEWYNSLAEPDNYIERNIDLTTIPITIRNCDIVECIKIKDPLRPSEFQSTDLYYLVIPDECRTTIDAVITVVFMRVLTIDYNGGEE